ncbi:spore gernimation protein GerPD [Paenibacillaceae bacterium]|nr:spore gernimation protein GerPD [Paenibacillaceae bacterium]
MNFHVTNDILSVGCIQVTGVSSSSMLQIGDTECVTLYSMFDTPPESIIVGPLVPLGEPENSGTAIGE